MANPFAVNFWEADKQTIFNAMVRGLAAQGWQQSLGGPGSDSPGGCVYRSGDGLRCAFGVIIDDAIMDRMSHRNGAGAQTFCEAAVEANAIPTMPASETLYFLSLAQTHHDRFASTLHERRKRFVDLGIDYELTWPADVPHEGDLA